MLAIMGKQFPSITQAHRDFIAQQKIFFVATADRFGRINLSPKGLDSFRILNEQQVLWLNLTGSGNETAPHVFNHNRMTIMFCSFDEKPMILRLYGKAEAFHGKEAEWDAYIGLFPHSPGNRQLFRVTVDMVQNSCGFGVPLFEYKGQRKTLVDWAEQKGESGIQDYWKQKNETSIDGVGTRISFLKGI